MGLIDDVHDEVRSLSIEELEAEPDRILLGLRTWPLGKRSLSNADSVVFSNAVLQGQRMRKEQLRPLEENFL
jgi:hypothetical protein